MLSLAKPMLDVGIAPADVEGVQAFYAGVLGLVEQPDQDFDVRTRHAALFGQTTLKWFEAGAGAPAHTGPITARAGIRSITAL